MYSIEKLKIIDEETDEKYFSAGVWGAPNKHSEQPEAAERGLGYPNPLLAKTPDMVWIRETSLIWNTGWKGRDKTEFIAAFLVAAHF